MIRALLFCAILLFATAAGCRETPAKPTRVLFVGNSITYVNNLPATFQALAAAQGKPVEAAMLVRGGETLSGHLASGLLTKELLSGFDEVVLQERGGDLLCVQYSQAMIDGCEKSHEAHRRLVQMAKEAGAEPLLLGTYQLGPAAAAIEDKEIALAHELGIRPVTVSRELARDREQRPDAAWLHADGMHPGSELSMLMAIKLYRAVFGALPQAREVVVAGNPYDSGHERFSGKEVLTAPGAGATRRFTRERMATLLAEAARAVE